MIGLCIALADNQAVTVNDVFAVIGASLINIAGNAGEGFLLLGHRHTLEDAVVATAHGLILIASEVWVLRDAQQASGDALTSGALHDGLHVVVVEGGAGLNDDVGITMTD